MRGGFTGNALLIADAARQEALAELAERTKSSFYASTADDEHWRHERAHRRARRDQARQVLTQAGAALEPADGDGSEADEATAGDDGGRGGRISGDDIESALQMQGSDARRSSTTAAGEPSPPQRTSRWVGMRRISLPALRMRAAAEQTANENRMSGGGHAHPNVHLDIARPGTLAAETEIGATKSRRLHDITRVMVIEETYKQRKRSLASGGNSVGSFARMSQAALSHDASVRFSAMSAPGDSPKHAPEAESPEDAKPPPRTSTGGLAERVALYTQAATRAVAEARQDLELHSGWLRSVWLTRTQLNALMNDPHSSTPAQVVYWTVVAAIVMSSTTFCLETVATLNTPSAQRAFSGVEHASIAVFTAEYAARLVSAPDLRTFFFSWLNTVDLGAIVPYYVERGLIASGEVVQRDAGRSRIIRVLRLARIMRVLKLGNRSARINVVNRSIAESSDMLLLLVFVVCVCLVVCSSAFYYAERGVYLPDWGFSARLPFDQTCYEAAVCAALETATHGLCCRPKPSPFYSIPSVFWWCVVTLMTVGYGDVVPVTPAGKVVAGVTMVIAVLLLSLPISVIGTEFTQQWLEFKASNHMPDKRHKAPRFMALRRALAAHNSLLDELLLKTRDVLFEIDDLMARLQDKAKQQRRDAAVLAGRSSSGSVRLKHAASMASHAKGTLRKLGAAEEAAARDIKHETELLFMELDLKQRLMRLQELLTQAELVMDPGFLGALEQCRSTYGGLRSLARDVAALTEEADDVEEELDTALTEELATAAAATEAAAAASRAWAATVTRTVRISSGRIRVETSRVPRTSTAARLASLLVNKLSWRSPQPQPAQQPGSPRRRASDPLPGRSPMGMAPMEEVDETPASPRTPGPHRLSATSAPLPPASRDDAYHRTHMHAVF